MVSERLLGPRLQQPITQHSPTTTENGFEAIPSIELAVMHMLLTPLIRVVHCSDKQDDPHIVTTNSHTKRGMLRRDASPPEST